jgi:HlyD family secretion protein
MRNEESTMIRKYFLPIAAFGGVIFAVYVVVMGNRPVPAASPVAQPSEAPFTSYVSGAGMVEASTENIAIGTIVPGIVVEVCVRPGSPVKAGDPLFRIDDRDVRAELGVRQAALDLAKGRLVRLESMPRPEDLPAVEARVLEAEGSLEDQRSQLAMYESVTDKRAVSQDELNRRRFAVRIAEARLKEAQAQLALLKAGTWKPDLEIARAEVTSTEAQVQATKTNLDRLTVRAPVDGDVLQVKIRVGEYAPTGVLATPLVLLGKIALLHVRVDVDENDAWRIRPDTRAIAYVRGNRDLKTTLKFVRIEPYVIPKKSLTGDSVERVDTRVLQVLYSFDRDALPVYVGQQMDVFIEAPPVASVSRMTMPIPGNTDSAPGGQQ